MDDTRSSQLSARAPGGARGRGAPLAWLGAGTGLAAIAACGTNSLGVCNAAIEKMKACDANFAASAPADAANTCQTALEAESNACLNAAARLAQCMNNQAACQDIESACEAQSQSVDLNCSASPFPLPVDATASGS